jgi:hypothetical protein
MKMMTSPRVVVSLVLLGALAAGAALSAQRASAKMVTAANQFLGSLTPAQRGQATFAVDSAERMHWNFIPDETFPRNGLPIKAMTEPQRRLAHELMKTGLSDRGYLTYTQIMQLEDILRVVEQPARMARDKEAYRFSVFGTPAEKGAWGWRLEGHHISLNYTVVDGIAVAAPTFAGSNPAEVQDGPEKGKRVLAQLEDTARALVMSLDETQRAAATINAVAPNEIVTTNKLDISPLAPEGLKMSAMKPAQREAFRKVIDAYTGLMAPDIARDRMTRISAAGIDNIAFAWAGPAERGQKHYYRIQGPTFLVEFDNTQNNGNHIHSIWRDFKGDFGRDLLREHVKASH